jgi:leucyl-tRNA synthetase
MKGFNVLHPMGWDSFGLPAERYAVRTGTHPSETTKKNTDNFRRQLQALGFSYDWDREFATSDPKYYKWTQWIFSKLYEKGLAYQAEVQVNYCPELGTVLANEEVENGFSKEGGHPVVRRPLKQWMLKITAYAERLLQDLDLLDWPEGLKSLQRHWIGRSEGADIHFHENSTGERITVFTTCPDTLFGATYLVLAPEHPLVEKITTQEQRSAVEEYQKVTAAKSDMERTELSKSKTGVFLGAYANNPATGEPIPIWISDYVLASYGTGAIMAVPAHDERDFAFAQKFSLPIVCVKDPVVDAEELPEGCTADEVHQQVLAGERCWSGEGKARISANDEVSIDGLDVVTSKKAMIDWLTSAGHGTKKVTYKLRDWLFSRQRYWGEPFPVLHFEDGTQRVLDQDELPLTLPNVEDFEPTGDGRSPLAKVQEWVEITDPKTGKKALRETDTMPNWAGSCWYYLRFADPQNEDAAWSSEAEKYWLPVDLYVGGVEHAVLHLLYARFWHKVLYDCQLVSTPEPFQTLRNQGLVVARAYQDQGGSYVSTAEVTKKDKEYVHKESGEKLRSQIEKMSKSKLNGVSPDEILGDFGADALRVYEMFLCPLDKEKLWNTEAVSGIRRFLQRMHALCHSDKITDEESEEALKLGHKLVDGVQRDTENLLFNTAIAKMMEFLNAISRLDAYPRSVLCLAVQCLSPYAPHLAEELWRVLGRTEELSYTSWPEVDPRYLIEESTTYIIQVNGKVRARFPLPKGQEKEALLVVAKADEGVQRHLDGKEIAKVIYVPDKLLNIVAR